MNTKMMIIGLDGASWPVLCEFVKKGYLPNIKKLMDQGASGPLQSLDMTASPVVWTSLASGKTPEKHGVAEFIVDSSHVKTKRIWDIVEDFGMSVGLYGWLVTYPVKQVKGFMVPCWLTTSPQAHPDDLAFIKTLELIYKGKLQASFKDLQTCIVSFRKWGLPLSILFKLFAKLAKKIVRRNLSEVDYWQTRYLTLSLHMKFFRRVYKKFNPQFSAVVLTEIDNVCHRYWKYFEPEKYKNIPARDILKLGHVIPTFYKKADRFVGKIIDTVDSDTTIVIISDHGFQALTTPQRIDVKKIYAGTPLEEKFNFWFIGTEVFVKAIDVKSETMQSLRKFVQTSRLLGYDFPLFEVKSQTENDVFSVRLNKDVFDILNWSDCMCQIGKEQRTIASFMDLDGLYMCGQHAKEGIFIIKGKNIKQNFTVADASVLDLTPTVLRLLDIPIGDDMDGKVLEDVMEKEFLDQYPQKTILTHGFDESEQDKMSPEAAEKIKEHLKSLGYM